MKTVIPTADTVVPASPAHRTQAALGRLSAEAQAAWRESVFGMFSSAATRHLLDGATEKTLTAPSDLPRARTDDADTVLLVVVSGLICTYRRSPERQMTIRYSGHGQVVGLPSAIRPGTAAHGRVMMPSRVLRLSPVRFREVLGRDIEAAQVVMRHLVWLHDEAVDMACENVFWPVRMRVAKHLLDLAAREDSSVVVHASHQDIADAVGSVREVISRILRELRDEGLIERSGQHLLLCNPARLHAVASEQPGEVNAPGRKAPGH